MLFLFIDASTTKGVVAIGKIEQTETTILLKKYLPVGYQAHSKFLLSVIDELLKKIKVTVQDLSFLVVGAGPGSYTGMRIAAVVGKMFSYVVKIPLIGVSTLHGLVSSEDGPFAVLMDAKMGGAYLLKGRRNKNKITYISEPICVSLEQVEKEVEGVQNLVTLDEGNFKVKIESYFSLSKYNWEKKELDLCNMLNIAKEKWEKGEFSNEGDLDLLYLRKTQAEIEKENKVDII